MAYQVQDPEVVEQPAGADAPARPRLACRAPTGDCSQLPGNPVGLGVAQQLGNLSRSAYAVATARPTGPLPAFEESFAESDRFVPVTCQRGDHQQPRGGQVPRLLMERQIADTLTEGSGAGKIPSGNRTFVAITKASVNSKPDSAVNGIGASIFVRRTELSAAEMISPRASRMDVSWSSARSLSKDHRRGEPGW